VMLGAMYSFDFHHFVVVVAPPSVAVFLHEHFGFSVLNKNAMNFYADGKNIKICTIEFGSFIYRRSPTQNHLMKNIIRVFCFSFDC